MSIKKLESVRAEIAGLKAQIGDLQYPALCPNEIDERVSSEVSRLAGYFDPESLAWPLATGRSLLLETIAPDKILPLLAWLFPVELRDRLLHAAKPLATGTVPVEQRAPQIREIEARLHDLEVTEEQIIVDLEATGVKVERRQGLDPAVFLEMNDE